MIGLQSHPTCGRYKVHTCTKRGTQLPYSSTATVQPIVKANRHSTRKLVSHAFCSSSKPAEQSQGLQALPTAFVKYGAMLTTAAALVLLPVDKCNAEVQSYGTDVQGVSVGELGGKKQKSGLNRTQFYIEVGLAVAATLGSTIFLENSNFFPSIAKANRESAERKNQVAEDPYMDLPEFPPPPSPPTTVDSMLEDARGGLDILKKELEKPDEPER
mmetsp:Transcript_8340/g.9702  ORF Transcript_8340/g.9702 Transcript_8340/m.9702 type:complete len:215 (-) Transcript_8340:109-753(-)